MIRIMLNKLPNSLFAIWLETPPTSKLSNVKISQFHVHMKCMHVSKITSFRKQHSYQKIILKTIF